MTASERDCEHGQLARSCDRCADAREIAELRDEAENLRWELDATKRAREATEAECAGLRARISRAEHWAQHAMLMRSSQNEELLRILSGGA